MSAIKQSELVVYAHPDTHTDIHVPAQINMDREAWRDAVRGVKKSPTGLSN